MAKFGVCKNAYIQVAGVDLSDHCIELRPSYGAGGVQAHAFGANQEYQNPGLTTRGLTARFINDFAAASVFATLNPLKNGAKHVVQYRNENTTASALNPTYSGLWFISSCDGLVAGTMGSNSEVSVTWTPAGEEGELTS
jgi:hypothetical protein